MTEETKTNDAVEPQAPVITDAQIEEAQRVMQELAMANLTKYGKQLAEMLDGMSELQAGLYCEVLENDNILTSPTREAELKSKGKWFIEKLGNNPPVTNGRYAEIYVQKGLIRQQDVQDAPQQEAAE